MKRQSLLLLVLGGIACGPRAASVRPADAPPSAFPSRDTLAAVSKSPAPALSRAATFVDVSRWPLVGPFPDGAQAREALVGTEPWTEALRTGVAARAGVTLASQAMQCTARQLAQFVLEHGQLPAPSLRSFMAARCGATIVRLSASWVTGEVPADQSDAALHTAWNAQLAPMYRDLPPGNTDVGVWLARKGDKAVAMRVTGQRRALVTASGTEASTPGVHRLQLELLEPAASVRVMVNRGRFGFAECAVSYRAPTLEARCPTDIEDAQAWISVAAFPAGRVLGERVLDLLVWPHGAPVDAYERIAMGEDAPISTAVGLHEGLLGGVNALRKLAQLEPVIDEAAQSATATEVAPYYFAAQERLVEETVADVVALGLRAGWQVSGLVRQGQLTAPATVGTDRVGDLLALAIEQPFGRETLLDPAARRVSIGAVWAPENKFMGALISTYSLLEDPAPALADRVFERFSTARKEISRAAPERDPRLDEAAPELRARLLAGEIDADVALRDLMRRYTQGVSGYFIEMNDPETIEIPPALLKVEKARLAIVVARHRRPQEPWGRYVVFVLVEGRAAEMNI